MEDYFHVEAFSKVIDPIDWGNYPQKVSENTDRILGLMEKHEVRGTFFVLGWVAERNKALVQRIASQGHEIASHGYMHRKIDSMAPTVFRKDIRMSKDILENITGSPVIGFRAPTFSITEKTIWALEMLEEEGFRYDSSIFPIRHDRYGYPSFSRKIIPVRGNLVEIPLSTLRVFGNNFPVAGGGYLRLFPLSYNRAGIRWLNSGEKMPAVLYIHPWELDDKQPKVKVGIFTRFRHYYNLKKTEEKISALLAEFSWGRICDSIKEYLDGMG